MGIKTIDRIKQGMKILNMNRFKCRLWSVNIGKFNLLTLHFSAACSKEWRSFAA